MPPRLIDAVLIESAVFIYRHPLAEPVVSSPPPLPTFPIDFSCPASACVRSATGSTSSSVSSSSFAPSVAAPENGLVVLGGARTDHGFGGPWFSPVGYFDRLPLELTVDILASACGSYRTSRRDFLQTRRVVGHTCRYWCHVVHSVAVFWNALDVTPHLRVSEVRHWVSHWGTGLLDLKMRFDDLYSLRYALYGAGAPRLYPQETIDVFAPYFSRCKRLALILEEVHALPEFLDRLRRARADHLVQFSITRVTLPFASGPLGRSVTRPRRLFARTGFPSLRRLRLENTTVGWWDLRFYAYLFDLILLRLAFPVNMSTVQFYRILLRATQLRRLCVKQVPCDALLDLSLPAVYLPSLRVLDLELDGSVGVACVLSICVLPALSTLSIYLSSDEELRLFLHCAAAMASITQLSINGALTDLSAVSRLYSLLPRVVILDLSRAGPVFCHALYDHRRGDPHLCPLLEELRVINVPLLQLRSMLELRIAASRPVRRLTMYRVYDLVETVDDLAWYFDTFQAGDLEIDPPTSFDRSWTDDA
ncbi:hypothetical protein B0H16DRAFT_1720705 [Mycena metata]|uniref:F-box domain-containing protein n=1 Tax=Mycena metata TaxID=1033252 RepID=A0AAD7NEF5_9AGAR|nr:hypothetical protein B0H16DRAFT_1720705 [Mycena metata]